MKKFIFILLLGVSAFSCKKDKGIRSLEKDMEGTWELVSTADFSGYREYTTGSGNSIQFDSKNVFKRRVRFALTFQGTFSLAHKKDCEQRATDMLLTTSEPNSTPSYVELKDGTLFLSNSNCAGDVIIRGYKKI